MGKYSNMPFLSFSKDNLELMINTLEASEIGKVMFAIKDFIYNDVESNDLSTSQRDMFNKLIEDINRKY